MILIIIDMEYDCHIFSKCLVFEMKILVFQSKTLDFDRNARHFDSEIFERLGFSHLKFEMLGISSKIPRNLKT